MKRFSFYITPLLVVLLCFFAVLPLFHPGFFTMHDDTQPSRVFEMAKSIRDGMIPVRWVADLGYGYGYPIFNFYAPLPYYIGALFLIFGTTAITATKIMFGVGIVLSGITMYMLVCKFFGKVAGLVSALVYVYFPYHAVNIYVRGAVDELFAYAFLPLVFLGLFSVFDTFISKQNSKKIFRQMLFVVVGVFGVIVSHNLSGFMLALILIPSVLLLTFLSKDKKNFFLLSTASIFLGLLLASFYVIPVFSEMGYTNVSSQVGGGANYKDHFVCLSQFWYSPWGYGGSEKGCIDGFSFMLGKIDILLACASFLFLIFSFWKRNNSTQFKISIVGFLILIISLFFTMGISQFVWSSIPYMVYIQYPWRFINFIGLSMGILTGFLIYRLLDFKKIVWIPLVILLSALNLYTNAGLFTPQMYTKVNDSHYVSSGALNFRISKISDEYLPKNFDKPKNISQIPKKKIEPGMASLKDQIIKTGYFSWEYNSPVTTTAVINVAYFPAWTAYVNGERTGVSKNKKGTMDIIIPKGQGELELEFKQTPVELVSNIITLCTLFGILLGIIILPKGDI